MKKAKKVVSDPDMRAEYDFARMKGVCVGSTRGAQRTRGYGKQVVGRLARDIQRAFPGISGFSERNVWLMRAFYAQWEGEAEILQRPVAESARAR